MRRGWLSLAVVAAAMTGACAQDNGAPRVTFYTSAGEIVIELFPEESPITVENFLTYVNEGFYDGLIFHRSVAGFVIQAGGFEPGMVERPATHGPIQNESTNGVSNVRGTISMARMPVAHSADSQFFISLVDNSATLDRTPGKWGYAVFGTVLEGMDVVDAIAAVPIGNAGGMQNVPIEPVAIVSATVVQP